MQNCQTRLTMHILVQPDKYSTNFATNLLTNFTLSVIKWKTTHSIWTNNGKSIALLIMVLNCQHEKFNSEVLRGKFYNTQPMYLSDNSEYFANNNTWHTNCCSVSFNKSMLLQLFHSRNQLNMVFLPFGCCFIVSCISGS